ncbi:DUF2493 domain-containing protein [Roseibium sp. Sym1]|uniref:DUF2493 domain-containing protein n=1 Tax=Roseibium sp. Sym1 TaxID=3016006 RepID=UPI0022B2BE84|nr:DUF2493 domain-containing protein [Roseibium sp. Sym1]
MTAETTSSGLRVIVCGGRDYNDYDAVFAALDRIHAERPIQHLWHGNSRGADTCAHVWGMNRKREVSVHPVPAKWSMHGRRAGPLRNQKMLGKGIDLVIAFPGGDGTADMVRRARKAGVEVFEIT